MSKNEWKKSVGVAHRILRTFAVIFSQCAFAGQNLKAADKAAQSNGLSVLAPEQH